MLMLPLFIPGWTKRYHKKMYGLLNAAIVNGSEDVCSPWTLAQVDNWKHLISVKCIIVF